MRPVGVDIEGGAADGVEGALGALALERLALAGPNCPDGIGGVEGCGATAGLADVALASALAPPDAAGGVLAFVATAGGMRTDGGNVSGGVCVIGIDGDDRTDRRGEVSHDAVPVLESRLLAGVRFGLNFAGADDGVPPNMAAFAPASGTRSPRPLLGTPARRASASRVRMPAARVTSEDTAFLAAAGGVVRFAGENGAAAAAAECFMRGVALQLRSHAWAGHPRAASFCLL